MVEILSNLGPSLADWHRWAAEQPVTDLLHSRYAKGCLEGYYGLGITLSRQPQVYAARQDRWVTQLGNGLLSGWHSAILHGVLPVEKTRYSLTFRHLQPEFQGEFQQLSLHLNLVQAQKWSFA